MAAPCAPRQPHITVPTRLAHRHGNPLDAQASIRGYSLAVPVGRHLQLAALARPDEGVKSRYAATESLSPSAFRTLATVANSGLPPAIALVEIAGSRPSGQGNVGHALARAISPSAA